MKKRNRNFVDYVYLSELDSVRVSTKEQIEGERALFRTIVYEGKAVVLTYNQIVDSVTFLHCIRNEDAFKILLSFFKDKRLLVNQYEKDYSPDSPFKSSYFNFLNEYEEKDRRTIMEGLIDSIKYGDDVFLRNIMPPKVKKEHRKEIYDYIKFILTINSYMYEYNCYVYSIPEKQLENYKYLLNLKMKMLYF